MATKFIVVSIEIMHDVNLNQSQKFILAEAEQLSQLDKGCIASNNHFSELIGITKENVSKNINDLKKKGYIDIEIVAGSRNHTRIITVTNIVRPPYQSSKTPLSKQQETKENKQSNTTSNKTIVPSSSTDAERLANYLLNNILKINPTFKKPNISTWAKDISLAIRIDGRTVEQLKECIDWIYSNKGQFWQKNILSGKKLREKFDTMYMQATTSKPNKQEIEELKGDQMKINYLRKQGRTDDEIRVELGLC